MSETFRPTPDELAGRRQRRDPHSDLVSTRFPVEIPARAALTGRTVRLEPADQTHDTGALWTATHGDPDREQTWRFMGYGPFASRATFDAWFAGCTRAGDPMWWTAIDASNEQPIGMAALMRIELAHAVIEIGNIWFVPDARATPATTEAIFLLMDHAMATGYRRLEWKCDAANVRSRRAALRLGFRYEGTFANHMVIKGRNRDTAWYSITDGEWPGVRAAIGEWLDPANFDGAGREKAPLRSAEAGQW